MVDDDSSAQDDCDLLCGSTSYLSMLHDSERNGAYRCGLESASRIVPDEAIVLDVGAGTGLLSMLACQAMPSCRVVACEVSAPCAQLARQVIERNGMHDRISVVTSLATELAVGCGSLELQRRADLCVFELFDSQLLGESILPTLRDCHARLLSPEAVLVPSSAIVKAVLISSPVLANFDHPSLRGAAMPLEVDALDEAVLEIVSHPFVCLDFDFASVPNAPAEDATAARTRTISVKPTSSAHAHALLWWWELRLGGRVLSTCPARLAAAGQVGQKARGHWKPCLSFLATKTVMLGSSVSLTAAHDDVAIWFNWSDDKQDISKRWSSCDDQTRLPPSRSRLHISRDTDYHAALKLCFDEAAEHASSVEGGVMLCLLSEDGLMLDLCRRAADDSPHGCRFIAVVTRAVASRLQARHGSRLGIAVVGQADELTVGSLGMARSESIAAVVIEPWGNSVGLTAWAALSSSHARRPLRVRDATHIICVAGCVVGVVVSSRSRAARRC